MGIKSGGAGRRRGGGKKVERISFPHHVVSLGAATIARMELEKKTSAGGSVKVERVLPS